jgi:AAA family ATP:ADP antiporter
VLVLWGGLYIFCLMTSYYVLRPIRDTVGIAGGNTDDLPWLFTGTLLAMLVLNPLFALLVRRLSARIFIPAVYLFFISNLIVLGILLSTTEGQAHLWTGYAFFIWLSVFNLFVVSVFWMLMVDIVDTAQSKRLFGILSAAASVGAIAGSSIAASAKGVSHGTLMFASALLLGAAIFCVARILALVEGRNRDKALQLDRQEIGGSVWAGLAHVARSPYLLAIGLYILLYAITSTFLYFQQSQIAAKAFATSADRRAFFAQVDLAVNVLTLLIQVFLTGRILKVLGIAAAAAFLPLLTVAGFGLLAAVPTIAVLVGFQVVRRVGNFGLSRPTREVLFTVVSREDKYKAKSVIDTVVYRLGDQVGSWSYALVGGLGMVGVSLIGLALAAVWTANAVWLGRRAEQRAGESLPGVTPAQEPV